MRALGATVERTGERRLAGAGGRCRRLRRSRRAPLDFGNSGTGCRLVMGAVAGCPIEAVFDGDASLRKRPMRRILDPLEKMGARTRAAAEGGRLPVTLQGAVDPIPIEYEAPVPSAQLKSAVLLAGLAAPGATTVIEKEATRDHTEKMLKHFGASLRVSSIGAHGRRITLEGQPELEPAPVMVPADPSSAAFPLVGGADRPRLRGHPRRRDDQSAAHRPAHDAARDGRGDRSAGSSATRAARTSPTCACALARSRASTCRPSARRR